jgi:hypothetical protein
MSKLADMVTATVTHNRVHKQEPYNIHMAMEYPISSNYHYKVRFIAQLGCEYVLPEEVVQDKVALDSILKDVRKGIVNEVFGEFYTPIKELEHLLYLRNYDKAQTKLRELQKAMFS